MRDQMLIDQFVKYKGCWPETLFQVITRGRKGFQFVSVMVFYMIMEMN